MALDKDITIVRVAEDVRWTDKGQNQPIIRVEFKVGDHGPFTERIPKADYTAAKRDDCLNKFAREVR
jgi:hypothetical protein